MWSLLLLYVNADGLFAVADPPHQGRRERGQFYPELGGRSSYLGSTFWANPIQTEVRLKG
jgi:hypothetical protein